MGISCGWRFMTEVLLEDQWRMLLSFWKWLLGSVVVVMLLCFSSLTFLFGSRLRFVFLLILLHILMQVGIIQFQFLCRIPACILYLLVFKRQSLRKRSDIQLRKCSKSSDKLYSGTMFDFLQDSVASSQYRFLSNSKSKFSLSLCYKHKLITNLWKGCINKQRWSKITLFWFCNNKHFEYCSTWRQVHHIQLDDFGDEVFPEDVFWRAICLGRRSTSFSNLFFQLIDSQHQVSSTSICVVCKGV